MNTKESSTPDRRRGRFAGKLSLMIFLLAVITLVSWSLNRNSMVSEPENKLVCVAAKRGAIEQGLKASGIIIRDEMVYLSPAAGTVRLVTPERDRVRTGTIVAQIVSGETQGRTHGSPQTDVAAERPGIVSFVLDGLERTLTPSSWQDFSARTVSELVPKPVSVTSGVKVDTGQALFRIIDNYRIYVLVFPEPDVALSVNESLVEGARCNLRFDSVAGSLCSAKVVSRASAAKDDARPVALLLELTGFPQELYYLRHIQTKIITKIQRGIVIPRQALVKGKNDYLVYVPANLGVNSRPVTVIAGDESQVVCEGVKDGERVVVNPYIVHDSGMTVWR